MRVRFAISTLLLCAAQEMLAAQQVSTPSGITTTQRSPAAGGRTKSIGQPQSILLSGGAGLGIRNMANETSGIGEFRINAYGEALSGTIGAGGWLAEPYAQFLDSDFSGGMRLSWKSQLTNLAGGADYNFVEQRFRGIFSYSYPVRRSGLFHDGSMLRLDYLTAPGQTFILSIDRPLARRNKPGQAWARSDMAQLTSTPRPKFRRPDSTSLDHLSPELRSQLNTARTTARNMQRLVVPWVDHGGGGRNADRRVQQRLRALHENISDSALNVDAETQRFHDALDRAFQLALIADDVRVRDTVAAARDISNKAREILLSEVLYPYNFKLGQVKEDDTTLGLDDLASGSFLTWLHTRSGLPVQQHDAVASVFNTLLEIVEDSRIAARQETGTSRFVWLPLQYGLRLEQRDSQEEIDNILAHSTHQRFSAGNHVEYVINEQFQIHLRRTLLATRRYHVLWTHDFRGNNDDDEPDRVGYQHVLHSYYEALTAAVRAYDTSGTFPTYLILLDQWFYEANNGTRWMNVLEDPTRYQVRLPREFSYMEDSLHNARRTLNDAIDSSRLLTEHRRLYGDKWLHNLVKVQVNITNPSDPSFWTWRLVKGLPIPDTWMRDHRKIAFYDLTEANPYSGGAILTGAGIGEHYVDSWEDRSLLICGPVALRLKAAARDALSKQGMSAQTIPVALQEVNQSPDSLPTCAQHNGRMAGTSAIQLQSGTGFDNKEVSVAKAVLYTLMPKGSVIKIPDSIWNGTFWGAALIGAALRGVQVVIIAPARANAPATSFGSLARSNELLHRFVIASDSLGPDFRRTGGSINVGMFRSTRPVTDIAGRVRDLDTTMAANPWLRRLFPFADSAALAALIPYVDSLARANPVAHAMRNGSGTDSAASKGDTIFLHLKANLLASGKALSAMQDSTMIGFMRQYLRQRIVQVHQSSLHPLDVTDAPDSTIDLTDAAQRRLSQARDSVILYTVLGSSNQNDRSMISDGEAAVVLSGWPAMAAYIDMLMLMGQSEWVTTTASIDALFPPKPGLRTRLAHWFKHMF